MSFDLHIIKQIGDCRIDCAIQSSEQIIAVVGPSGTGKSTLLNCIAGLETPDAGHVIIGGRPLFSADQDIHLAPTQRGCGYVFQENRLFPHMTVKRNLLYGRGRAGPSSPGTQYSQAGPSFRLAEIADMLDLAPLLQRRPGTLSGGEQRRVAIGRALLSDPAFLLLDEPLSSLDPSRGDKILRAIERLRDHTDMPILYVSHNNAEVERMAQAVFTLT